MDIGSSFSYVFQDPQWLKKVGIGGGILLVAFLPLMILYGVIFFVSNDTILLVSRVCALILALLLILVSLVIYGYWLTTLKNVAEGSSVPLPDWSDYAGFFRKGLMAFIGLLILYLPIILIACCFGLVTVGLAAASSSGSSDATAGLGGLVGLLTLCFQCLSGLYALVVGVFQFAPLTRYALSGQLSTFWDFKGNWAFIQSNIGNYIIAVLLSWVAGIIGILGGCIVIGLPFTSFYGNLVTAHLFGQFARGQAGATPMMVPPPANSPMRTT